jgi:hypothetical protein
MRIHIFDLKLSHREINLFRTLHTKITKASKDSNPDYYYYCCFFHVERIERAEDDTLTTVLAKMSSYGLIKFYILTDSQSVNMYAWGM